MGCTQRDSQLPHTRPPRLLRRPRPHHEIVRTSIHANRPNEEEIGSLNAPCSSPPSPVWTPTPPPGTYYDKQRARAPQALLRLAGQRISVLFNMLRDGTFREPRTPDIASA
ncbi:hypothetical protein SAV31267_098950 [Streptomyces avermitilis]|uniref:Uncharacterized protein n=1 Tax=Streptomyces avermitilis TaxID=33903 RepID=A0A4D4N7L5_STRAX|nr:hypothetical protein SAV31267_098950 [Streptomyces avermitilis]